MLRRLLILAAAVLAAVAVAAGCGDDDSGASEGAESGAAVRTSSLSKEQFVDRANAVCNRRRKQMAREVAAYARRSAEKSSGQSTAEGFREVAATIGLPAFQDMIDALRQLGAPEGDEDELEALLTEMQSSVDELEQQLPAGSVQFFRALDNSAAMARRYGVGACAIS